MRLVYLPNDDDENDDIQNLVSHSIGRTDVLQWLISIAKYEKRNICRHVYGTVMCWDVIRDNNS